MGIGGWLTNYKRFNVLPDEWKTRLSPGDFEHFATYITRRDIDYIASLGMDHIRLGFDQVVLEAGPGEDRGDLGAHRPVLRLVPGGRRQYRPESA